ncbi:MAG: hypothetical protein ACTSVZ_08390 [Promethearchaeota archaeon]
MVIEISKNEIIEYEKMKKISELTMIREKILLFEKKYGCFLSEFKEKLENQEEKYEEWDDFIEWTAYIKTEKNLMQKLEDIDNAQNINITQNQSNN